MTKVYVLHVTESDGETRMYLAFTTRQAAELRAAVECNNSNASIFTEVSEVELDQPCPPDRSEVATLAEVYFGSREPDDITKWVYDKYEQRRVPGKHRSGVVATAGGSYLFWSFDGPDALAAQIVEAAKVHYGGGRVVTDGIRGAREAQRACDAAAAANNNTRVPGPSGHVQEGM